MINKHKKLLKMSMMLCVLTAALFYAYEYALRVAPGHMQEYLMHSLNTQEATVGFIISLYYFMYAPLQLVVGIITDYFRPRKVLSFAILCCVIGCLLFPTPGSILLTSTGRILIGIGSAFAYVAALTLASRWLSDNKFTFFAGSINSLGMLVGWIMQEELQDLAKVYGWRQLFNHAAILGVVLFFVLQIGYIIRNRIKQCKHNKLSGLSQIWQFYRATIQQPQLWIVGFIGTILYLSLAIFGEFWGPLFLHTKLNISLADAGKITAFIFVGCAVGGPMQSIIARLIPRYKINFLLQTTLSSTAILLSIYYLHTIDSIKTMFFIYGFFSSANIVCFSYARLWATRQTTACTFALINLLCMLSGMLFQPLASTLLDLMWSGKLKNGIRLYTAIDFQHALCFMPICAVIAFTLCFFLKDLRANKKHQMSH